ncbi:uncharacterized protein [Miscanthus floridulus]|uniref:uncharacterized protein n=1 Tax=Miscanthus floridulus TaxID=154761 RepID=UPI00345776D8
MGWGPLDHLPDVGETVPGASASSPALPGGGGGGAALGSAVARLGAEANKPEERVLGNQKRPTEVPTLAPLKALKVNPGYTAHWVAEAQAALQCGVALARADPKEPATQGGATDAALTQAGVGAPPPHEGEARELDGVEVSSVAEAAKVEAFLVSKTEAAEARAPRTIKAAAAGATATTEATMVEARAPGTTEATMAEAGAPRTTEADVITARLSVQEVEMKAAEASVAPLVQGPPLLRESAQEVEVLPISSDDTS